MALAILTHVSSKVAGWRHDRACRALANRNAANPDAIFIWVPKTAGTSLFSILAANNAEQYLNVEGVRKYFRNKGIVTFGHLDLNSLLSADLVSSDFVRRAWKFAFVRNPFDRAVSLFEYLRVTKRNFPEPTTFSIFCRYLADRAFKPVGLYNQVGLNQLNPQAAWLLDDKEMPWPDFIGRFERYEEDLQVVLSKLGLHALRTDSVRLNISQRKDIKSYYGHEEIAIIRDVYHADFELFGYSDEPYW